MAVDALVQNPSMAISDAGAGRGGRAPNPQRGEAPRDTRTAHQPPWPYARRRRTPIIDAAALTDVQPVAERLLRYLLAGRDHRTPSTPRRPAASAPSSAASATRQICISTRWKEYRSLRSFCLRTWTNDAALKEIDALINEIAPLMSARRFSAEHTQWLLQTRDFFLRGAWRKLPVFLDFTSLKFFHTGS